MKNLEREVLFDLRAHRGLLVGLTLGVVLFSIGHALIAWAAGALAACISAPELNPPLPRLLPRVPWIGSISALSYVGLAAAVVKAGSGAYVAHSERRLASIVANRLRVTAVRNLLDAGPNLSPLRALATLAVRVREIETAVSEGTVTLARSVLSLVPLALCLFLVSPALTAVAGVAVVPFAALLSVLRKRLRNEGEHSQAHAEVLESGVDELVRNVDLFRAYGAGKSVVGAIERGGDQAGRSAARADALTVALSGSNEVLGALAVVGAVVIGARFGIGGAEAHLVVPFAAVFFMAYRPLRDLGDARSARIRGQVALDALQAVFGPHPVRRQLPDLPAERWGGAPPTLELRCFGARDRGPETTLRVEPGEVVCVVGPTGSGKTTLFRALLGLEPSRGELWLGGTDASGASAGPRARPLAWVPQDAPLVTGTIVDNVRLVGGDDRTALEALRTVGGSALTNVPSSEVVGPGGRPLSGGERRQLSLARALATELPILLLDEPTEGLDRDANDAMLAAMSRLRGRRSVLVATHREDVMRLADRVVRIGAGSGSAIAAE